MSLQTVLSTPDLPQSEKRIRAGSHGAGRRQRTSGMTLVEMMITVLIGVLVLTTVVVLFLFGLRSFGALSNYADMDARSRMGMDLMLREIRESNQVTGFQTNGATQWLSLSNSLQAVGNKFTWDPTAMTVVWEKTGQNPKRLFVGCANWTVNLYLRAPDANGAFPATTNLNRCKRINMSWQCYRTNIISRMNSESIVTADVVLRNLQE
jgi:Tfp pilus assembly protein PilW